MAEMVVKMCEIVGLLGFQDHNHGVVDMTSAFFDARQNSQILRRPQDDSPPQNTVILCL
jgi:hypothetical protein